MKRILFALSILIFALSCNDKNHPFTHYVDPFIGTGGHGHTFPGAIMPFGMIQLSPDTRLEGWDGCSGYHYSDDTIYGFSHTHLSGTGVSDYGDLLIMPMSGDPCFVNGTGKNDLCSYSSHFKKRSETASPGYYGVTLEKYEIKAELTASYRSGVHRYSWLKGHNNKGIIIDLAHRDEVIKSGVNIVNDTLITGYRISSAWAKEQHFYFAVSLSSPIGSIKCKDMVDAILPPFAIESDSVGKVLWLGFNDLAGDQLVVKIGISGVDEEGALNNLQSEIGRSTFDEVRKAADTEWNKELGKIEVKGGSKSDKVVFYTALYHTMTAPNLWSDVDGRYRGMDMKIHQAEDSPQYTVFSLWDTYRALHPLLTIIDRKRTGEFVNTFLRQYQEGGGLPVWELAANETECMIGYHSISVIYDAYKKGISDFDLHLALEAMQHSANLDHFGLKYYREYGFISADSESESVSKTLEYAYDDWCIAMMAKEMGNDSVYREFIKRAQYYKNLYDPATKFFRPKTNNTFIEPFDPKEVNFHLTEANSWQYNFYVPHDIKGHIELMGGVENYVAMLDEMFETDSETTGRDQADITGLIGQYAHGNEPSHHMAYLYACAGEQYKTASMVRKIMREMYTDKPDGLCGNEDCGQMSAWYVLSAMGFYPVCPGNNQYVLGSPKFSEVVIHLENGKQFVVKARRNTAGNRYIRKAMKNDTPFNGAYITHEELVAGGELLLMMGASPNYEFGKDGIPLTSIDEDKITPVPYFSHGKSVFFGDQNLRLSHLNPEAKIIWQAEPPLSHNKKLLSPGGATVSETTVISAFVEAEDGTTSKEITSRFYKIPENRTIKLKYKYENQYSAGGDHALIDFLRGSTDFRTGRWQGFHQVDLHATVALEQPQNIKKVSVGFLQDQRSWIFAPLEVEFQISIDGVNFKTIGIEKNTIDEHHQGSVVHDFSARTNGQKGQYIRVIAKNRGVCPSWHPGAGEKAWIFADEIVIE